MKKLKSKLSSYIKFIKEHLNIIIIVPTLLGGIWQLIELSLISTSFIRFFSITQLVADGLLMLFVLCVLYLGYRIGISLIKKRHFYSNKKPKLLAGLFLVFASIIYVILVFEPLIEEIKQKQNIAIYEIFVLIPFTIMVVGIFLLGIVEILGFLILKFEKQFRKAYEGLKGIPEIKEKFTSGLTFVFLILIGLVIKFGVIDLYPYYSNFKRSLTIPENLANKSFLENKIKNDFKLQNKPSLIYFNDKYLFYRIRFEKKEEILVLDFNEIITSIPANNNGYKK